MGALADAYAILKKGTLWSSTGRCKGYAVSDPREAAQIDAYIAALDAGQTPAPPQLATYTGKGLVGMLAALADTAPAAPAPAPSTTSYLFADDFDGPAGTPPDATRWINLDGITYDKTSAAKAKNAFLDGQGNLVLRVTREPWYGRQFAGAIIGSYQYQTGWPPKPILASWPVPFRWESRVLLPTVAGAWSTGGWLQNVDRSAGIAELDCGETRGTYPTIFCANQHLGSGGTDAKAENAHATMTAGAWHVCAVEATEAETRYYLDGNLVATHSGVSGRFGVLLHNVIADLTSWGSGGKNPDPADAGPWDVKVDYVRVTAL
jgi:hypothetical protein